MPGNEPGKGNERATYGVLERRIRENAGFPKSCEPHGNGATIVLVGVTTDHGAEESSVQGKVWQGVQKERGCWRVMR